MIVGIVAAKENSKRFPNKNRYIYNGYPLFWHSVKALRNCNLVDKTVVTTDSLLIKEYCKQNGVEVIWRHKNATNDEEPLLGVLRYAYKHLETEYDYIATIMANCPGHDPSAVKQAINLIKQGNMWEVRSFDDSGEETGLIILKKNILMEHYQISSHLGCVISNAKEIHYKEDILSLTSESSL